MQQQNKARPAARGKHSAPLAPRPACGLSFFGLGTSRFGLWISLLALGLLTGCASSAPQDVAPGAGGRPGNVFVSAPGFSPLLKRVAVLPLISEEGDLSLAAGKEALEPILRSELAKTRKFEVFCAPPDCLRARTGQAAWSPEDALPPELFTWARETAGCDGVLFCRLTVFRGYAPLAVGWRMRLVDARTRQTIWCADEVFDASQPAIEAGARRYQKAELATAGNTPEEWVMANSPRQFGQYATAQLLATLPNP